MSKLIAVDGLDYEIRHIGYPTVTITAGTFSITTLPSDKVKCNGDGVYKGGITGTITGVVDSLGNVQTVSSPATINPSANKVRVEGELVMRVDDESDTVELTAQTSGGSPTTIPVYVLITDANQDKVFAE